MERNRGLEDVAVLVLPINDISLVYMTENFWPEGLH